MYNEKFLLPHWCSGQSCWRAPCEPFQCGAESRKSLAAAAPASASADRHCPDAASAAITLGQCRLHETADDVAEAADSKKEEPRLVCIVKICFFFVGI